jgi:PAS domain S-box-containing protein
MPKLGWQARLAGLIVLVLGGMLLFQLLYVVPHITDREVQHEESLQQEIVRDIAWALDSDLLRTRDRLIETARRLEFAGTDTAVQESILEIVAGGSSRLKSLVVMDGGGWFVASSGEEDFPLDTTRSHADEPYFSVPFEQGQIYYQEPRFYPSEQFLSADVSVPIESDTGERVGVLLGTLVLNHLVEMVADCPLEEGMVASVVDREGRVVAQSGMDVFSLEEGPLSLDYSNYPLVKAIKAGDIGVLPEYEHDGVPYYGTYAILESNGWGVVVGRPMGLVLAEANALSGQLLLANAVLFAIALLVALLLARQIMAGQRMAERALRDSEEKFRSLFEQSREAIALVEPVGRVLDVNKAWLDLFGYSRDELPGLNVIETYANPEEREDFRRRIDRTGFVEDEVRYKKKDGTVMDCQRTVVARKDAHGNPIAYQSLVLDVTGRRKAEEELRSSEERFRALFEQSRDAISLVARDGRILEANQAFLDLLGYTRDELPGLHAAELYANPQDREDLLRRIADTGQAEGEVLFKKKDGTVFGVELSVVARTDEHGNMVGVQGITRDITERRRAEQALRDSEEKFRALFEHSADAVSLVEPTGRYIEVNRAWLDLYGYSRDELPNLNAAELYVNPEDRGDLLRKIADSGSARGEVLLRKKDGTVFESELSVVALRDGHGNVVGMQGITRDVTERTRAARERERLLRQLEEKTEELEQVVFVSSHDLRSPLVNIQGFTAETQLSVSAIREILQGEEISPAGREKVTELLEHEIPEALGYVLAGSAKMDSLLAGLLRLSRLGRAALTMERLDMNELLGQIVNALEFRIKEAGATVRVESLPSCTGDRVQVDQVFSNLLDNALKFLDPQRRGEIVISGTVEGDESVYCVEDNGIGIAQEHYEKIFEIFQSLRRVEGSGEGLGLSIVQSILGRHEGRIWVESVPGRGSRFYVALPQDSEGARRRKNR